MGIIGLILFFFSGLKTESDWYKSVFNIFLYLVDCKYNMYPSTGFILLIMPG